jgi:ADP-ribose pyrophosphatase YjhB (NUDIX family)
LQRKNTPWMNWYWSIPWWRLDIGESMISWAIREIKEEVWIEIIEEDILFKWVVQHKDDRGERIYFVINLENFQGTPKNMEPEMCSWVEWFDLNALPEKITPQVDICLNLVKNKINYLEYWY